MNNFTVNRTMNTFQSF